MDVVVKICGLTTPEAVEAVVCAGADRAGFVFAPSPRQVSARQAAQLAAALPPRIERVAVFKHAEQGVVDAVLDAFRADWVQADVHSLARLRLPAHVRPLPVVRDGQADELVCMPSPLLYEAPVSGQGVRADWQAAATLASRHWLMLAGGLNPGNVGEALRRVRPAGVDVSSGVERATGVKDPQRIADFLAAVRAAPSAEEPRANTEAKAPRAGTPAP